MSQATDWCVDIAECLHRLRLIPRLVVGGFGFFSAWYVVKISDWYMSLPPDERTLEATGLPAITIPAVTGIFSKALKDWLDWKPDG